MNSPDPRLANGWEPTYEPAILTQALPVELCQDAIAIAQKIGFESSPVFSAEGPTEIPYYRRSETAWLKPDDARDLYQHITGTLQKLNNECYRFSIYGMDKIQIIRYEPGCFFNEHCDLGSAHAANRKISLLVQLSPPEDYVGGDIVLAGGITVPKTRGGGCVFPAWVPHRVEEITSGTRYSLAAWAKGTYFL
ncbi:MAG: 2OG-Fe(II) oxygenase [Gammaproteobacteria bacterium]|nr:2OG-Fe(II) oxygenase [Gammaproteobacteria bacterium]